MLSCLTSARKHMNDLQVSKFVSLVDANLKLLCENEALRLEILDLREEVTILRAVIEVMQKQRLVASQSMLIN